MWGFRDDQRNNRLLWSVFGNRKNEKISIQMREWNEQQQKRVGVRECLIEGKTTRGE